MVKGQPVELHDSANLFRAENISTIETCMILKRLVPHNNDDGSIDQRYSKVVGDELLRQVLASRSSRFPCCYPRGRKAVAEVMQPSLSKPFTHQWKHGSRR